MGCGDEKMRKSKKCMGGVKNLKGNKRSQGKEGNYSSDIRLRQTHARTSEAK